MPSGLCRRETHSPPQSEGVCHPLDGEERHTLLCRENEYVILSIEKIDILSFAERRGVCHPLDVEERHTLLCGEKEYVILSMEKRDTLSSAKRMNGVESILPYAIYSLFSTLDTIV